MKALLSGQSGAMLTTLAVAGLVLGSLMVVPVTASLSTSLKGVQLNSAAVLVGPDSALEHGLWRLIYEAGYADSLTPSSPADQYNVTLNGATHTVTVTSAVAAPPGDPVMITKVVDPKIAPVDTLTTFTYTIDIVNDDSVPREVTEVKDKLTNGFSYVAGSTSGLTDVDPSIAGAWLTWSLSPAVQIDANGGTAQLVFQADASKNQGSYYNSANADITGVGTLRTGKTAQVRFANSGNIDLGVTVDPDSAQSAAPTTFQYTVSLFNNDSVIHEIKEILNTLPAGFFYVVGSTSGLTAADPLVMVDPDTGQELLTCTFSAPYPTIGAGAGDSLIFDATATLDKGRYYDEASATLADLQGNVATIETGPTAPVTVFWSYQIIAQGPKRQATASVLILPGTVQILTWQED